ncbi:MAG: hypothetical protein KKB21_02925 [Nanoarchaeota archaeon]|nr:hypothetical protein [Nanoarchaeota archaeon]
MKITQISAYVAGAVFSLASLVGCGAQHGMDLSYKTELRAKFGGNSGCYTGPVDRYADRRAFPDDSQPYAEKEQNAKPKTMHDEKGYGNALSNLFTAYKQSRK